MLWKIQPTSWQSRTIFVLASRNQLKSVNQSKPTQQRGFMFKARVNFCEIKLVTMWVWLCQ